MEPEQTKNLTPVAIEKDKWVAFVHEQSKKVVMLHEFRGGGSVKTLLKVIVKSSKEEMLAEFKKAGYVYGEPKAK
jgi:hypothetical protein